MSGKQLGWLLVVLTAATLVFQTNRGRDKMAASKELLRVEQETIASSATGQLDPNLLRTHLAKLKEAAEQDPTEARIPIAIGTMHLLLKNPNEAVDAYRHALTVEERYEIYQNLAEAQRRAGDLAGARESAETAVKLAPFLARRAGSSGGAP